MKPLFLFVGCIFFVAVSCKKDQLVEKEKSNSSINETIYSKTITIPSGKVDNGYLEMTIECENEVFLENYALNYSDATVDISQFKSDSDVQESINTTDRFVENSESKIYPVSIHLNWENFAFEMEKGKKYDVLFSVKGEEKSLVYWNTFYGVSEITSTNGFGAVRVINTHSYWKLGCLCTQTVATAEWYFYKELTNVASPGSGYFYQCNLSLDDNLEVRTVVNGGGSSLPSFYIGSQQVFYKPRLNYGDIFGPIPSGATDYPGIKAAKGLSNSTTGLYRSPAPGTLIVHFVG